MKRHARLFYLLRLLELGARDTPIKASTSYLSTILEVSQQSASRILNDLYTQGYIEKEVREGVLWVKVTDRGLAEILELRRDLDRALKTPGIFTFQGRVFTGFGEGAYYVSKRPYRRQFFRSLGFDPYPGTLNIRLEDPIYIRLNQRLKALRGIKILGFYDMERSFGEVKAFKATLEEDTPCAVIYASRSLYGDDVIEIISPHYLRERLGLEDGNLVILQVHLINGKE